MHDLHWSSKANVLNAKKKKKKFNLLCLPNRIPRLMSMRIEINWYITRWNEIKQTSYKMKKKIKNKINSNRWKVYNKTEETDKYKMGRVRIFKYKKKTTMTTTTTTVKSQPRKSYKTELHAMVLRINMYVSKSIWLNALSVFSVSVSVHRFRCACKRYFELDCNCFCCLSFGSSSHQINFPVPPVMSIDLILSKINKNNK